MNPNHDRRGRFTTAAGAQTRTGESAPEYGRGKPKRDKFQSSIDSAKNQLKDSTDLDRNYELRAAIQFLEAYRGSMNSSGVVDYVGATTNIHGFGALNGAPTAMLERAAEARGATLASGNRQAALLEYAHKVIRQR